MIRIVATERRRRSLSAAEWIALQDNGAFWRLVEEGFVGVSQVSASRREIQGKRFVGRAIAGEAEVVVQEKVPGTLPALLAYASGSEVVLARAQAAAADFDAVSRALMQEFVRGAGAYIANRREPHYEYREAAGVSLGGSLDTARTARLHARGLRHLLAYTLGNVVRNTDLDKVTLAALDGIDRAAAALKLPADTMYTARWLAGALEEVRDDAYHVLSQLDFLDLADGLTSAASTVEDDQDLAQLASVVLLHQGFEWTAAATSLVPRAWFIDLETLFERAVRRQLQSLLPLHHVDRGQRFSRRLFQAGTDTSKVNPDVVVHTDAKVQLAADVKYKSLRLGAEGEEPGNGDRRKKPGRPDLYQLLVHARSLEAPRAVLIYPADETYRSRRLGTASTGAETWVVEVRPWLLADDLQRVVAEVEPSST